MTSLAKAQLQEVTAGATATPVSGTAFDVQFNPQSLKLGLSNKVEGGHATGRQNRQYLGKTSTSLQFDLVFDTADQGTTDAPVSVRTRTAMVERFLLPKGKGNDKQAPPKCRFSWDKLVVDGIIEDLTIDFELFAANGTPLRAKMGVTIKEQDAKYELLQTGPGANNAGGATAPGTPASGPGSTTSGPVDRSAQALGGESAADFATRMGLDPTAWRGIAAQLGGGSPLSLTAGASIAFSATLSAGAGVGLSAGVSGGADVSVEAAFGVAGGASADAGASAAGFAIAAAGGLGAALQSVAIVKTAAASSGARQAYGDAVPATAAAPSSSQSPSLPDQSRTPLRQSGLPSVSQQAASPPAPPPPAADPRATSYGYGVPLRPRARGGATVLAGADPSAPPWTRLPTATSDGGGTPSRRPPRKRCGCGCG